MGAAQTLAAIAQVEATEAQTKVLAEIADMLAAMHIFNEETQARASTRELWRTR